MSGPRRVDGAKTRWVDEEEPTGQEWSLISGATAFFLPDSVDGLPEGSEAFVEEGDGAGEGIA